MKVKTDFCQRLCTECPFGTAENAKTVKEHLDQLEKQDRYAKITNSILWIAGTLAAVIYLIASQG